MLVGLPYKNLQKARHNFAKLSPRFKSSLTWRLSVQMEDNLNILANGKQPHLFGQMLDDLNF